MKNLENQPLNPSNETALLARRQIAQSGTPSEPIELEKAESKIPIGQRIRALRRLRGLSLVEAAKTARISYQGFQAIETGADPRVSTLARIAAALDIGVVDLLDVDRFHASLAAAADEGQVD